MSAQEVFNKAYDYYQNLMNIVEEMSVAARKYKESFSTQIAKREIDEILQAMLIHVSASDGWITPIEMQFIDKITDQGDILLKINKNLGTTCAWEQLPDLSDSAVKRLLLCAFQIAQDDMSDFAYWFSFIDSQSEKNYLVMIIKSIMGILMGLAYVDNNLEDNEKKDMEELMKSFFLSEWKNGWQEVLNGLNNISQSVVDDNDSGTSFVGGKR